jgi:hypothetical protein
MSGPNARALNLDFLCIVSLLQGAVEALDRQLETSRDGKHKRIELVVVSYESANG